MTSDRFLQRARRFGLWVQLFVLWLLFLTAKTSYILIDCIQHGRVKLSFWQYVPGRYVLGNASGLSSLCLGFYGSLLGIRGCGVN